MCLKKGEGVSKDLKRGAYYFKLAADQGDATAQNNYGMCLYRVFQLNLSISVPEKTNEKLNEPVFSLWIVITIVPRNLFGSFYPVPEHVLQGCR
jgi:hypothetical protein